MEYVKVPINVLVKAARYNRSLNKYLRFHLKGIDAEEHEVEQIKNTPKPDIYFVDKNWQIHYDHSSGLPKSEYRFRGKQAECELYVKQMKPEPGQEVDDRTYYVDKDYHLDVLPEHKLPEGEKIYEGSLDECKDFIEQNIPDELKPEVYELNGKEVTEEELRQMAKEAGIKSWHNKKVENLISDLTSEEFE